jgi:hypothetical protein
MCWSKYEAERRAEEEERRQEETIRLLEADAERRAELLLGKKEPDGVREALRR